MSVAGFMAEPFWTFCKFVLNRLQRFVRAITSETNKPTVKSLDERRRWLGPLRVPQKFALVPTPLAWRRCVAEPHDQRKHGIDVIRWLRKPSLVLQ